MNASLNRPSRPRRYDLTPIPAIPHPEAAYAVAALDELRERLCDIIADLPQEAVDTFLMANLDALVIGDYLAVPDVEGQAEERTAE